MSDKTVIHVDEARQESQRLRQIGSQFNESVSRLQAKASQYDGCWGGDKFGQAFAKGYVPNSTETLKNVSTFGQNITGTCDQVDNAITDFETTDQNNANNL